MTSRERLLAVLRGEIPDRVPISCYELVGYDTRNFCNTEPSYRSLMEYIREKTDCICMWNPRGTGHYMFSAYAPQETETKSPTADGYTVRTEIDIDGYRITGENRVINNIETVWQTEPLCKTLEDFDALLSLPFEPETYSTEDINRITDELGDHGILMPSIVDAAGYCMGVMEFGAGTVNVVDDPDHFEEIVRELHRRNMINLERMLRTTPGDMYRIYGPEYYCPPYMAPKYFERYVVPYVADMVGLIHRCGRYVRVHCHGRTSQVLDMIASTGCDGLDPCEETPDGDLTLSDLKQRVGDRLTLFGSMQLKVLECSDRENVIRETERMMKVGKPGGRYVIMPTAAPINIPLNPQSEENYRAYIDTALSLADY